MMLLESIIYILRIFSAQYHIEPTYNIIISTWIQSIIGQWLENIPYGMLS